MSGAVSSVYSSILLSELLSPRVAALEGRVLDVGCGRQPYRALVRGPYVAVDWPSTSHQVRPDAQADAAALPFGAATFDAVLCSEVLEHVADPRAVAAELARVLRPGGQLLVSVPSTYQLHELPHDYWRYTPQGLRATLERNGFAVDEVLRRGTWGSVVGDLVIKRAHSGAAKLLRRGRAPQGAVDRVLRAAFDRPQRAFAARAIARGAIASVAGPGTPGEVSLGYVAVAHRR